MASPKKIVKKYFYKLNISPNIEIISDNTRDYYLTKAMRKTLKEFEKNVDETFKKIEKIKMWNSAFGRIQRNVFVIKIA